MICNMRPRQKVSVIIATYNAEKTLAKAIDSVLCQTYDNLELLVVDGKSSDKTIAIASNYSDSRLSVFSESDNGIYDAWNKGVSKAVGEWVIFIGADDYLAEDYVIEKFMNLCMDSGELYSRDIVYGNLVTLGEDGAPMDKIGAPWRDPWCFGGRFLWADFPIPIMASIFRREAIIEQGGFDVSLKIIADIDLVLRSSLLKSPYYIEGVDLTVMGYGGVSTNPRRSMTLLQESYRVRSKLGLGTVTNAGFVLLSLKQIAKYMVLKVFGNAASVAMMSCYHGVKRARLIGRGG